LELKAHPNDSQKPLGKALSLNGSSQYLDIGNNPVTDNLTSQPISFSAWIKASGSADYHPIISKYEYVSASDSRGFNFYLSGGQARVSLYSGATSGTLVAGPDLRDNQWHHLVGVYTGSQIILYVDGKEVGTTAYSSGFLNTANSLRLGQLNNGTGYFQGAQLDEVKLYDFALSLEQIKVQHNRGAVAGLSVGQVSNPGSGPVAYWKFDEGSGLTAVDSSGYSHTAIASGTTIGQGKVGKSRLFNGSTDYLSAAPTAANQPANAITVMAWVKFNAFGTYSPILDKAYTSHVAPHYDVHFRVTNNTNLTLTLNINGTLTTVAQITTLSLVTDRWYHMAATYNGTSGQLYIDGQPVGTSTTAPGTINYSATDWYIGRFRNLSGTNYGLNGSIDEVKIYNYARTLEQIHQDMGGSPIGYWKFDEGHGSTAYDAMGNFNGTLVDSPAWADGARSSSHHQPLGRSLTFNGSSTYIDIPHHSSMDLGAAITISAWIKWNGNGTAQRIISRWSNAGVGNQQYIFGLNTSNQLSLAIGGGTMASTFVPSTNWHHVVAVHDGTTGSIYVDGEVVAQENFSITPNPGTQPTYIGAGGSALAMPTWVFNGNLDEVKLYNYALTENEITVEYNRGAAMVLGAGQSESASPSDNLIASWKFDEGTGTTAKDTSGNALDGSKSFASWSQGKIGKALDHRDQGSGYPTVTVGDASKLNFTGNFTISSWVNRTGTTGASQLVVAKMMSTTGGGYTLAIGNAGEVYCQTSSGSGLVSSYTPTGTIPADSSWYHLTIVRNGSSCRVYINGLDKTSNFGTHTTMTTTTASLRIGNWAGITFQPFAGSIDNVKIWDTNLTPAQVAWEYNQGAPVAHWRFDEKQGAVATDHSGNGVNGTLLNFPTDNSQWVAGKYNNALSFDGSNDYVSIATNSILNDAYDTSFSFWIKPDSFDQRQLAHYI
jgi:hypothetical protein